LFFVVGGGPAWEDIEDIEDIEVSKEEWKKAQPPAHEGLQIQEDPKDIEVSKEEWNEYFFNGKHRQDIQKKRHRR
jgi:hypothetical protein